MRTLSFLSLYPFRGLVTGRDPVRRRFHPGAADESGPGNKGEINTLIIHFNNGVSVGVIINPPYGAGGAGDYFADLIASIKAAG